MSQKGIYLSSWAKITILATLIVFCFVFGFYAGTRSEQDNLIKNKVVEVSKPTEAGKFIEWKEYKNDELGISFNYPAECVGLILEINKGKTGMLLYRNFESNTGCPLRGLYMKTSDYVPLEGEMGACLPEKFNEKKSNYESTNGVKFMVYEAPIYSINDCTSIEYTDATINLKNGPFVFRGEKSYDFLKILHSVKIY